MLTQRGAATLGLGLALGLGSWVLSLPELIAAGAALFVLVALALVWVWVPSGRPQLTTTVNPSPTLANSTVGVAVTLRLKGFRPAVIRAPISDGRRVRIWSRPGTGGVRSGSFPLAVGDRGELRVGPFSVHRFDPLALARRRLGNGTTSIVTVWPEMTNAAPVRATAAPGDERIPVATTGSSPQLKTTELEPAGLRPYVFGDELRLVHWTASARGRGMLVRTFEPAATVMAQVLLDDRASSHTGESFELALSVAASLIGAGAPVGSGHTSARLLLWSHLDATGSNSADVGLTGPHAFDSLARCVPAVAARVAMSELSVTADVVVSGPNAALFANGSRRSSILVVDPSDDTPRPGAPPALSSLTHLSMWERFLR